MRAQKQHMCKYMLHNRVGVTSFLTTQKQDKWLINSVLHSFHSVLIKDPAILNCKLKAWKFLNFPTWNSKRGRFWPCTWPWTQIMWLLRYNGIHHYSLRFTKLFPCCHRVFISSSSCSTRSFRGRWRRGWRCSRDSSRSHLWTWALASSQTVTIWRWLVLVPKVQTIVAPTSLLVPPITPICPCLRLEPPSMSTKIMVRSAKLW